MLTFRLILATDKNAYFFKALLTEILLSPIYTSVSNSIVVSKNSNIWMFLFV
jgi:hypothetical protein